MSRVVAVVGPTATGKSELAVTLAERLGGEVVNADSMQLYRGMDIGTAKPGPAERRGVPHHLLDVWEVTERASVAEYQRLARAAIDALLARGRLPVLVGGSGLYVRAVLDDLDFPGTDPELRARLEAELAAAGPATLHARLSQVDPEAARGILPSNGRRVVRALEVLELTGRPFAADAAGSGGGLRRGAGGAGPVRSGRARRVRGWTGCGRPASSTRCGRWPGEGCGTARRRAARSATSRCSPRSTAATTRRRRARRPYGRPGASSAGSGPGSAGTRGWSGWTPPGRTWRTPRPGWSVVPRAGETGLVLPGIRGSGTPVSRGVGWLAAARRPGRTLGR